MINLDDFKTKAEKAIEHLKLELNNIRTGRATPNLVENINVKCYSGQIPLVQLATTTAPDPRSLLIQPWDKSIIKDIEKAIQSSNLGLHPVNEGQRIRLTIPLLTEEKRKELIKITNKVVEKTRITIRNIREITLKDFRKEENEKSISEDELFIAQKDLQKETDSFMEKIQEISDKKEKEILTV